MKIEHENVHMNIKTNSRINLEFTGAGADKSTIGGSGIGQLKITPEWIMWSRDGDFKSTKTFSKFIEWLESDD